MNKKLFLFLIFAPLLGVALAGARIYYQINIWTYKGEDTHFSIQHGENFSRINYRLSKKNLISNAKVFHRYSQVQGIMTSFKVGDYIIKKNSNMIDVINVLTSGISIGESITIPEGKNLFQIAEIFHKKEITDKDEFIKYAKSKEFVKELGLEGERVEGYLYPETYKFSKNVPAKKVIQVMVNMFNQKTKSIDFGHPKLSKHEIIILASIVEKETGASFERPMIAGLYLNRLNVNMRLQADPTTIYGIYENFNGNLRKRHLQEKTPYNTYRINGLPAGPICNPGVLAIKAVLNPTKHNFKFFVSKNDGTHEFTRNYKEHLRAVNKWQRTYKNRKGKSWRDLNKSK